MLVFRCGLLFGCFLALASCESANERAKKHVEDALAMAGPATIRSDVDALRFSRDFEAGERIPKAEWTPAFMKFEPIYISIWDGEIFIVTHRHFQHETGLIVRLPSRAEPKATAYEVYSKLADRIYFYQN